MLFLLQNETFLGSAASLHSMLFLFLGSQEGSSMEMYGSASDKESADNICTFEPGIQWGSFSSLKMSR